jgi:transcriptional regulator with XRE-family HTH domain
MKPINELIRDMREDRDVKQNVIADVLGMSQQQYSRYETGESELPLRAFFTLADYYNVSADYLMGRKEWSHGVPGLDKKVTGDYSAGEVMNDILALDAAGRAAVVEYIDLQRIKQNCQCRAKTKEKDGTRP